MHIWLKNAVDELWSKEVLQIALGKQTFEIQVGELRFKREQFIVLEKKGIPVPDETNIFSVVQISDIYVHIELE